MYYVKGCIERYNSYIYGNLFPHYNILACIFQDENFITHIMMRSESQRELLYILFIIIGDLAVALLNKFAWIMRDAKIQYWVIFCHFFAIFERFDILENHFFCKKKLLLKHRSTKKRQIYCAKSPNCEQVFCKYIRISYFSK